MNEAIINEALTYLGAKDDECLSLALSSFLEKAEERMARQMTRLPFDFTLPAQRRIAFLIESWLAVTAITGFQPLQPKNYEAVPAKRRDGVVPVPVPRGEDRPEWMRRRWV